MPHICGGLVAHRAKCGATRIGRGSKIDNPVQIAHNAEVGRDCVIVAQCGVVFSGTPAEPRDEMGET